MAYRERPDITTTDEASPEVELAKSDRARTGFAPMVPSWLSYLYTPILPLLDKIKIRRAGSRDHNPRDILLPAGYWIRGRGCRYWFQRASALYL